MTVAKTNWGSTPPTIPGANGFFEFNVPIPANRTGDAVLFTRWQREDPDGEGFYNCSDITLEGSSAPVQLIDLGPFIEPVMDRLKAGDAVHFRLFDNTPAAKEVVDITLPITQSNLNPNIWGKQLADKIAPTIARVGEKDGDNVVFNLTDASANSVFALAKGYSKAMAITPGGDPGPVDPRPPIAVIKAHPPVKSGENFTMDSAGSVVYNPGAMGWHWSNNFHAGDFYNSTAVFKAPEVQESTDYIVYLVVYDNKNKTSKKTQTMVTVNPRDETTPEYEYVFPDQLSAYKSGTRVYQPKNKKVYECKPFPYSGFCKQWTATTTQYEPGVGSNSSDAWIEK